MPTSLTCALAAVFVIAGSTAARAQAREVGVTLGASVATLEREHTEPGDDSFGTRTGITAGAYALLPLKDRLAATLELLFTEKGGSLPLHDPNIIQGSLTTRYKFQYLDLPVLLRVKGPRIKSASIHAFAGPTMSMRLSAKQQTVFGFAAPAGFERDLGDEMKRFDLGLTFGAGVQFGRVVFDGRYTYGFSDALDDDNGTPLSNRGMLITVGARVF